MAVVVKNPHASAGDARDVGLIPGLGRSPWSCCCSVTLACLTLCDPMECSLPGFPVFPISQNLLKLMSIESVMPSSHLILSRRLLFLASIFPSIRVFSNLSVLCIRWPKYWRFRFTISPSSDGPISFRIGGFDHLAVQGTRKSLLQHHSSKASILWRSTFFMLQLSHPYMTTRKTIALTRWTFASFLTCYLGWS